MTLTGSDEGNLLHIKHLSVPTDHLAFQEFTLLHDSFGPIQSFAYNDGDDTVAEGYQSIEEIVVSLLYLFHYSAVKQLIFYGKLLYIYCILT